MSRARVLLVDDDASIRRFVALALEDLEIDLVEAENVPQARERLAEGRCELVITDLMMPGETGLDLLQQLAERPELRAGARLAVFSAGLNAAMQARLAGLDVWRQLSKPISLVELEECVREAVGAAAATPATATEAAANEASAADDGLDAAEQATVARHFAGDRSLFLAYRASCVAQFAQDIRQGDDAMARGDAPAVRRLAHSLKSVLLTLGQPGASAQARQLEDAGARADWELCRPLWQALRTHLADQR
ncbi:MAG: response regulator [Burkholderiaceae bacterium]|nr:MAG: response regulator [Burkholderiaceae bacterium]